MEQARYAVLDVETTSGDPTEGRVMEVAVLALDGAVERLRWESLIDPRTAIPPFIGRLTGIHRAMLSVAPRFPEVARTLLTLTEGRIVVAHNVRYDMTALAHEFARTGLAFGRATLCTERAARLLFPRLPHYNLGGLCRHLGLPFSAAHRALPDAEATTTLLLKLIDAFGEERVLSMATPLTGVPRAMRA